MENNIIERVAVSEIDAQVETNQLIELTDLQLAVIGGGIADVVAG